MQRFTKRMSKCSVIRRQRQSNTFIFPFQHPKLLKNNVSYTMKVTELFDEFQFIKIFKEESGMTVKEYRKYCIEQKEHPNQNTVVLLPILT